MRGGRPGRARAATVPVVRWRRRQRTIVLGQTRKSRAASATGSPPSIAPSSRSRRSAEYCFMRYNRTLATLTQPALDSGLDDDEGVVEGGGVAASVGGVR